ncbi:P-loop containing nucleoside triphosphate hydrolase protein [Aspergillus novoparasiticus]|uniref:P-loop containing nucleoside triphosphate hydrolase protein n=1 Tax=Aspergillus novoparasiticus TaxID=986946 RepID=A0A5N6EBN2_9EURO|nr:P-loop containing nucleoside triphosphate hydrolase protein [Aspergillus novoparasiticus]
MVLKKFFTNSLEELCTKEQLELLDSIDTLRLQGISHYISLPQIIVCGDQSSGKSSVLEAISGVSFPVRSNLCTRFPTELVLRKSPQIGVSVSIVPHHSRTEAEQQSLSQFHEQLEGFDGLPRLIDNAKAIMGISTHGKAFSNDLLRVEVSGPDRPHLTIVDLPGLIHSETKQQSAADVKLVQDVVQSYMREPRSIILAVVSAKNDFANQIVLTLAREADRTGSRTLGVITKPDTLTPGSETEAMFVSLAKNQQVSFRHGWHVLKNQDSEKSNGTLTERDAEEEQFFAKGVWRDLPLSDVAIKPFRERLSKVLLGQIATELPSLIEEIQVQVGDCQRRLERLGRPRTTIAEQKYYLLHISQNFQNLVRAATEGTYNDPFFNSAQPTSGYSRRIRAVMQNLNQEFTERINSGGHYRQITEGGESEAVSRQQVLVTREEYIQHIQNVLKHTRGKELPGTFNPLIIGELFREQSSQWETIARGHVTTAWNNAKDFVRAVVLHIGDITTAKGLLREVVDPRFDQLLKDLQQRTSELLQPHQQGHPITYNHYFTENLQKARREAWGDGLSTIICNFFGVSSLEATSLDGPSYNLRHLRDSILQSTESSMSRFAATEALECMLAYYKVALKRFIDGVAIEVIETNLIKPLVDMFAPLLVFDMADDLATRIAGESIENKSLRDQLSRKLHILRKGSETCTMFIGIRGLDIIEDDRPEEMDNLEEVATPQASIGDLYENERPTFSDMSVNNTRFSSTIPDVLSPFSHEAPPPVDGPTPAETVTESDYDHIGDQSIGAPSIEQRDLKRSKKSKKVKTKKKSSWPNDSEL